jgi:hypothetical protein
VPVPTVSYIAIIIVSAMLGAFILFVIIVLCKKNVKCRRKNANTIDDDSYEEDDDICVDDAKPVNPFAFKKHMEELKNSDDPYKDERYKFYATTQTMPAHAKAKIKANSMP